MLTVFVMMAWTSEGILRSLIRSNLSRSYAVSKRQPILYKAIPCLKGKFFDYVKSSPVGLTNMPESPAA
ncbi:hypothetical protein ACTXT7_016298 [Hymenolepis weldensis]